MADELRFSNGAQLKNWLEKQPVEWSRAVATRTALRVLPLIAIDVDRTGRNKYGGALALAVFRCTLISSGVARRWTPDDMAAYAAAYAYAANAAANAAAYAANAAYAAAYAYAANAAASAAANAANAANAAANAANAANAAATWEAVSGDARWLAARGGAEAARGLMAEDLWLIDGGMPKWERSHFKRLRDDPQIGEWGFKPWLDWYAALAPVDGRRKSRDIFGPDLSHRIATQPNEWWKRGARAVNADIAAWLAEKEAAERPPEKPKDLDAIAKALPEPVPSDVAMVSDGGRIAAVAVAPDVAHGDAAQIDLEELIDCTCGLADRLTASHNVAPFVVDQVRRLRDFLPATVETLNFPRLEARLRPLAQAVARFSETAEAAELHADALTELSTVVAHGRALLSRDKAWRDADRERRGEAPEIPDARAAEQALDAMRAEIAAAPDVAAPSVNAALDHDRAMVAETEVHAPDAAAGVERRRRLVRWAENTGNFAIRLASDGLKALKRFSETRTGKGMKGAGEAAAIIASGRLAGRLLSRRDADLVIAIGLSEAGILPLDKALKVLSESGAKLEKEAAKAGGEGMGGDDASSADATADTPDESRAAD